MLDSVTVSDSYAFAQLYDDDIDKIIGEFYPGEVAFVLPGLKHHLWHTFRKVILKDKWGWVTADALVGV